MNSYQSIGFLFNHCIALATQLLKSGPVEHCDLTSDVFDHTKLKQSAGGRSDTLTPHAQNVGEYFLGHYDLGIRQAIEAQQQTATESLINRVVKVAGGCLRHLRY